MKKIPFLFALLAGITASAQSHIHIEMLGATYTTSPAVKFVVSWNSIPTEAGKTHNAKIWLWIDCLKINADNTSSGNTWTRAEISATPAVSSSPTSTATLEGSTNKGFWLNGVAGNYSATVTALLANVPADTKFNWCAYASDCPPNATIDNGTYTLKGSPPFKITYNGNSYTETSGKNFTLGCIASLTDATGCPGIINYPAFSAGALGNGSWGSMGEFLNIGGTPLTIVSTTAAGGGSGKITYQWYKNNTEISGATVTTYLPPKADATAAGTFNYTRKAYDGICYTAGNTASGTWTNVVGGPASTVTGCSIDVAMYNLTLRMNWANADTWCKSLGSGWRLPTKDETASCFCTYRAELNLTPIPLTYPNVIAYWVSTIVLNTNSSGEYCSNPGTNTYGMNHFADYENPDWGGRYCQNGNWTWCPEASVNVRCVRDK